MVFPDGHVDNNWGEPHRVKVLSEAVTAEETSILHENVQGGTATRSAINCPTAAKTGTTSELVDAWLDGYTPDYSTVVWMGYPNRRVSMTDVHGEPQQGGYLPAEIWHAYMAAVTEDQPCVQFPPSKEAINYTPFYGKYASTGEAEASKAAAQLAAEQPTHHRSKKRGSGEPQAGSEHAGEHTNAPSEPSTPAPERKAPSEGPFPRRRGNRASAVPAEHPRADKPRALLARPKPLLSPSAGSLSLDTTKSNERSASRAGASDQMEHSVAKEDKVEFEGEVIEALPNAMFRVKLDNDHVVLGHVAGKMRRFRIRILPGDRVRCELSPYDLDRARIVYRHR